MNGEKTEIEQLSFEEAYYQLEKLVEVLEQGNLNLDEAIGLFERGMHLARRCAGALDAAELRVRVIQGESAAGAGSGLFAEAWDEGKS